MAPVPTSDEQMVDVWQRDALLEVNCVHLFETAVHGGDPAVPASDLPKCREEDVAVLVVKEDLLACVASTGDVEDGTLESEYAMAPPWWLRLRDRNSKTKS